MQMLFKQVLLFLQIELEKLSDNWNQTFCWLPNTEIAFWIERGNFEIVYKHLQVFVEH